MSVSQLAALSLNFSSDAVANYLPVPPDSVLCDRSIAYPDLLQMLAEEVYITAACESSAALLSDGADNEQKSVQLSGASAPILERALGNHRRRIAQSEGFHCLLFARTVGRKSRQSNRFSGAASS